MPPRRGRDTKPRLETRIARDGPLVRQAQELRYRVFAEEMGARLASDAAIDHDEFDAHCEHPRSTRTSAAPTCRSCSPSRACATATPATSSPAPPETGSR